MPYAPKKPCATSGCGQLVEGGHCPPHEAARRKAANVASPDRIARQKHYHSKAHRIWRGEVLERDPVCVECGIRVSKVADHVKRWWLQPNPYEYALDPKNGQGMCVICHNTKSGKEAQEEKRRPQCASPAGYGRGGVNLTSSVATHRPVGQARAPSKFEGGYPPRRRSVP